MKKKLLRIFSSVLCLCMLTTACGGGTEDAGNGDDGGEAKDTLTIAVQADMADKDPINGSSTNDTLKIKANADHFPGSLRISEPQNVHRRYHRRAFEDL